jgi:hypothetical protein
MSAAALAPAWPSVAAFEPMRRCRDCAEVKPLIAFPITGPEARWRLHRCRPCQNALNRVYGADHRRRRALRRRERAQRRLLEPPTFADALDVVDACARQCALVGGKAVERWIERLGKIVWLEGDVEARGAVAAIVRRYRDGAVTLDEVRWRVRQWVGGEER